VHKTQGSQFGRTFLVVPKHCRHLTRELLYTALTRHRDELIILHEDEIGGTEGAAAALPAKARARTAIGQKLRSMGAYLSAYAQTRNSSSDDCGSLVFLSSTADSVANTSSVGKAMA